MKKHLWSLVVVLGFTAVLLPAARSADTGGEATVSNTEEELLPAKFDLREEGLVTPIRRQSGGTCWAHGTMAAIESNLLKSGAWAAGKYKGMPNLAEYHLDWWNGFNRFKNNDVEDPSKTKGLRVHIGGDYRVAAAYISRGDGVVYCPDANDDSERDLKWFKKAPKQKQAGYQHFYVRDIEWLALGKELDGIDRIKQRIMQQGAVGTAYCVSKSLLSKDYVHYQPPDHPRDPNHAVAIVGWDDEKITKHEKNKPPRPGAWLIKNSWGTKKGDKGYYWISYYDKHCCRHPEMGAVSFRNTEPLRYEHFYYHDYHGWRDTMPKMSKAFNAFTAADAQDIQAVSFYTAEDNVTYTVKIYGRCEGGVLSEVKATKKGIMRVKGLHTVELDAPVRIQPKEKFYVYLELSQGGQAIDRSSQIAVLLGKKFKKPIVLSKAQPGESFYYDGGQWRDLYDYDFEDPEWATFDCSANFCMKALAVTRDP